MACVLGSNVVSRVTPYGPGLGLSGCLRLGSKLFHMPHRCSCSCRTKLAHNMCSWQDWLTTCAHGRTGSRRVLNAVKTDSQCVLGPLLRCLQFTVCGCRPLPLRPGAVQPQDGYLVCTSLLGHHRFGIRLAVLDLPLRGDLGCFGDTPPLVPHKQCC